MPTIAFYVKYISLLLNSPIVVDVDFREDFLDGIRCLAQPLTHAIALNPDTQVRGTKQAKDEAKW